MQYLIVTEEKSFQIEAKDDFEVERYILAHVGLEKVIYFKIHCTNNGQNIY